MISKKAKQLIANYGQAVDYKCYVSEYGTTPEEELDSTNELEAAAKALMDYIAELLQTCSALVAGRYPPSKPARIGSIYAERSD